MKKGDIRGRQKNISIEKKKFFFKLVRRIIYRNPKTNEDFAFFDPVQLQGIDNINLNTNGYKFNVTY